MSTNNTYTPTAEVTQALNKAKVALMSKTDSAFFTTILFSLKFKWDDTHRTAYTDGITIGFNPQFFMSMQPDERVGVLIHEAMHVAYLHMTRLGSRDKDIFNQAADHVINLQLLDRGFKLPSMRLADPDFKGMGTEAVYELLKQNQSKQQQNYMPDLVEGGMPTEEEMESHVQDILVRAAIQSKMQGDKPGTIPGDIELFLDKLLNPKLPWNRILQKYLNTFAKSDYSWKKPNRRFMPDYYLPSLHNEALVELAYFVDTSGSVEDHQFKIMVSEIAGVFKMLKPKSIVLGQFDTSIKSVEKINSLQELAKCKFTGRGGTYIQPVLEWATKNKPQLLLIFTDGGFSMPKEHYKGNVVWLINDNPSWTAPYGKVIHYSTKR